MATLVPEYCLTLLADGEKLDASSMGRFIAVVSAMPVAFLGPLALIYWLRYLAVVLVASAEGEPDPPRPPDRNFDGFLTEFLPWMIWLVVGLGVGFLPLAAYAAAISRGAPWNPAVAIGLGLGGMPYALMALLMVFLHDDARAAKPWAIIAAIAKIGPPFLLLCLTIAFEIGLVLGSFAAAFLLRAGHFRLYIPASLACWFLAAWLSIAAMHTLGAFYAVRRGSLEMAATTCEMGRRLEGLRGRPEAPLICHALAPGMACAPLAWPFSPATPPRGLPHVGPPPWRGHTESPGRLAPRRPVSPAAR